MLRQRKMTLAIICFCIGAIAAMNTEGLVLALVFALSGVLCAFFAAAHRFFSLNTRAFAVYAAFFMIGAAYLSAYGMLVFDSAQKYDGRYDTVTAEVEDIQKYTDGEGVTLKVIASSVGVPYGTRIKMTVDKTPAYDEGDAVTASLKYYISSSVSYRADGVMLCADGKVTESWDDGNIFVRARQKLRELIFTMRADQPGEISRISAAAIIGDSDILDAHTYAVFRNSGVSHLLVVSGMHVSIISLALSSILRIFGVGMKPRVITSFLLAVCYGFFVGFTPSVIRTLIMLAFVTLNRIFMRHHDSINSLFVALMAIALFNPYLLSSMSTLLSFGSCLAILLVSPNIEVRLICMKNFVLKGLITFFVTPLIFSAVVSLVTMPVMLFFGGTVCYISPLINMLVTSLFGYVLIADALSLLLFAVTGIAAVGVPTGFCYEAIYKLLDLVYSLRIGSVSSSMDGFAVCAVIALVFLLVMAFTDGRYRLVGGIVSAGLTVVSVAVVALCFSFSSVQGITAEYTGSNSENAIFLRSEGCFAYVDIGSKRANAVIPVRNGYYRIDDYVFAGDISSERLAKTASNIFIDRVHLPYDCGETAYCEVVELSELFGFEICIYDELSTLPLGESEIAITDSEIRFVTAESDISFVRGTAGVCSAETVVMTGYAKTDDGTDIICDTYIASEYPSPDIAVYGEFVSNTGFDSVRITLLPVYEVTRIEY